MSNKRNNYMNQVEDRLLKDSAEVFGNFSSENAKYIIPRFIESATESVSVFIQYVPGDTAKFLEAVKTAGANIVRHNPQKAVETIRIIIVDGKHHPELIEAANELNSQLPCKVISVIESKYNKNTPFNTYVVVDHKRYRLEDSHKPFKGEPPDILKSEVSCNNPTKAVIMESSFNRLWNALKDKTKEAENAIK